MDNNLLFEEDAGYISDVMKLRFFPLNAVRAEGAYIYDAEGKEYLDMSAGWSVMSLGYSNKTVTGAIKQKLDVLSFAGGISCINKESISLAKKIISLLPGDFEKKAWYGHSGSDANEFVAKILPLATGRPKIVTFIGSYHGQTLGSYAMSGHPSLQTFQGGSNNPKLPFPYYYRHGDGKTEEEYEKECLWNIENKFFKEECNPSEVAAIVIEAAQSDGGDIPAGKTFLKGLERICRENGIYLIFDEVKIGLGRTGDMFGFTYADVVPDAVVLGKSVGGGLPLSMVVGRKEIMDCTVGSHLFTTSASPVVCAAGEALINEITEKNILSDVKEIGSYLMEKLRGLQERCEYIGDVRGRGLLTGTELVIDRVSKKPATELAAKVVYRAYELGMICYYTGLDSNVIEFTPPYILTKDQADKAVAILEQSINDAANGKVSEEKMSAFAGWS